MIDLHAHVLPGIDDGATTWEDSLAMAEAAASSGTTTVAVTPHVDQRYGPQPSVFEPLLEEAQSRLDQAAIPLTLVPGAEIATSRLSGLTDEDLRLLSLNRQGWLLIECPFALVTTPLRAEVLALRRRGWQVLLAHPERCAGLRRQPAVLRELVTHGARVQITIGSLNGAFGKEVQRFALQLVAERMAHNVASDAHDVVRRPPKLALDGRPARLVERDYWEWMTCDVPGQIMAGDAVQAMPPRGVHADAPAGKGRWPAARLRFRRRHA